MVAPRSTGDIGVLDLQGDVREHIGALIDIGARPRSVKRPDDLGELAGLILPGGESTTLSMLLTSTGLFAPLADMINQGFPIFGTCAGLVLVAKGVLGGRSDQRTFDVLDVVVRRNGFGRQSQSFETTLEVGDSLGGGDHQLAAVFIRAPKVVKAHPQVEVLAWVERPGEEEATPALVRQGPILASSFHPELTPDRRVHRLFVQMCAA